MSVHPKLQAVTDTIIDRSQTSRQAYLQRISKDFGFNRLKKMSCSSLAHGVAGCSKASQAQMLQEGHSNFGIISAYNDVLSAHEPFQHFPAIIKQTFAELGHTCQYAGGVPAMCDGVTQGEVGMELSLFSRDLIAQSLAIGLTHRIFDGALLLGICDKIVPGLMIGGLHFGDMPLMLAPAGPMPSGLPNKEKVRVRQAYAAGDVGKDALMQAELESYHSPGTCTFYGTANTNQMVVEAMGLQLPGTSFVAPYTSLRDQLTQESARRLAQLVDKPGYRFGEIIDERCIVNGLVALMASGGSTNHTIHMIAIARAAGIIINWSDFDEISHFTPLLAKIYPNGPADINAFQQAGGTQFLFKELLDAGLMHDIPTVMGCHFSAAYTQAPQLDKDGKLIWQGPEKAQSHDTSVLRGYNEPFDATGGLRLMTGNLGRGIVKNSAVDPSLHCIEAQALVFNSSEEIHLAYHEGQLNRDLVVVLRYQGPKACGIPEMHGLMPVFGNLLDAGHKVALVTDGRMSGASGKVPIVLHLSPEALAGGPIAKIKSGDRIRVDMVHGSLEMLGPEADELKTRIITTPDLSHHQTGWGRDLFAMYRQAVSSPEEGATTF